MLAAADCRCQHDGVKLDVLLLLSCCPAAIELAIGLIVNGTRTVSEELKVRGRGSSLVGEGEGLHAK